MISSEPNCPRAGEAIFIGEQPAENASGRSFNSPYNPGTMLCFTAPPDYRTGQSVVILPGGGYQMLAWEHEGVRIAQWLAVHGISAFVCFYPVADGARLPAPVHASRRAIKWVRENAANWGGRPDQVGVLGFSAGGHLAGLTALGSAGIPLAGLEADPASRPDFAVICYAVCSFVQPSVHSGSRENLLGPGSDPALHRALSHELMVTDDAPPFFLMHTNEDVTALPENCLNLALALRAQKIPVELHLYEKGKHGIGLEHNHPWGVALIHWLKNRLVDSSSS